MNADILYTTLKTMSWDDDRNKTLKALVSTVSSLNASDLVKILNCYSWDDGRVDCLKILKPKCKITSSETARIISTMQWDDGRLKILKMLEPSQSTLDDIYSIIGIMQWDDARLKVLNYLSGKLNYDDLLKLLNTFQHSDAKYKCICNVYSKVSLEKDNQEEKVKTLSETISDVDEFVKSCDKLGLDSELTNKYKKILEEKVTNITIGSVTSYSNNSGVCVSTHKITVGGMTIDKNMLSPGSTVIINGCKISMDRNGCLSISS